MIDVSTRTDLPFDPAAVRHLADDAGARAEPALGEDWDPGAMLLWLARVLEAEHNLPARSLRVMQDDEGRNAFGISTGNGHGWRWQRFGEAWSLLTDIGQGLQLAADVVDDGVRPARDTTVQRDAWCGSLLDELRTTLDMNAGDQADQRVGDALRSTWDAAAVVAG